MFPPHIVETSSVMLSVLLRDRIWSTRSEGPEMTLEPDTRRMVRRRAPPRRSGASLGASLGGPSGWISEDESAGKYGLALEVGGGAPSVKSRPLRDPPLYSVRLVKLRWESNERLGAR